MTFRQVRRRFLVLRATRWFPVGLVVPVLVLLLLDRGFSLAELGLAMALQGIIVFALELPTGGLSDTIGRRPVLVGATAVDCVAVVVLLAAHSMQMLLIFWALQGIYRALESGPLESWYVDTAQSIDADGDAPDLERAFSAAGVVTALALAAGATIASALVALDPFDAIEALAVPIIVAAVFRLVDLAALIALMRESRAPRGAPIGPSTTQLVDVIRATTHSIRVSSVLAGLIAVELFWGMGLSALESLSPAKLATTVTDSDTAAAILGPAATGAWLAAGAGAALAPRLAAKTGTARAAMVLQAIQGVCLVAIALATGPVGVIAFYVVAFGALGAIDPLYQSLLHRHTASSHRSTTVSAASMAGQAGGAIGMVLLGAIATAAGVGMAMIIAAAALMIAVPFYLPARHAGGTATESPASTTTETASRNHSSG
jgi:MFS family permease